MSDSGHSKHNKTKKKELQELKKMFDTKKYYLDRSTIKQAGYGVYSKYDIPAKTRIDEYVGEIIDDEEGSKRQDKTYFFRVFHKDGTSHIIDALPNEHSNIMKFVNGVRTPQQRKRQNCEAYQRGNKIYFKTLRDVKAGEELFIDYGPTYWLKPEELERLQLMMMDGL
jgi:SET domain-containing protein